MPVCVCVCVCVCVKFLKTGTALQLVSIALVSVRGEKLLDAGRIVFTKALVEGS